MSAGIDRTRESVQEHLDEMRRLFAPDVKVTFIARLTCGGPYMLVSDDRIAEVARLVQRHVSEMASAVQVDDRPMPCPWCGDVRCAVERMDMIEGKIVVGHDDDNGPVYYVECMACLARGPGHDYALDAVAQWNAHVIKVTSAPAQTEVLRELLAAVTECFSARTMSTQRPEHMRLMNADRKARAIIVAQSAAEKP